MAYKLTPLAHPPLLAAPDSAIARRAVFASKNLWVTPHHDRQARAPRRATLASMFFFVL